MAIHYHCRHCGVKIGSLDKMAIHSESLGFHKLTDEERQEMISYEPNGDIKIKSICEDCQEGLEKNPDYHQYDFIIH
ncbi:DUF2757 domain-containing protein [Bacillus sp. V3-13]|uniref:anti-sigma-F factor Fin family protein n=1 Tax=Bacillus sp. V3-13 TaxID=2053728 RepID=UPI000C790015|nr:anti-sigma-F factor Fin family protein [Bacillus sp. V3-13]PLR78935.1 DUF2757 domain-containing protein [Bacillus sp. V3-13]